MGNWIIRPAGPEQAMDLSILAKYIYRQYYLHLWHDHGKWYQDYMYSPDQIKKELMDPNSLYYIIYEKETAVAYLKLCVSGLIQGYDAGIAMELERIYIRKESAGKGLGTLLVGHSVAMAQSFKKRLLFLKAMDSSAGPIAFYQRMGFELCGRLVLPYEEMKEAYRGMVIMKKEISSHG